MSINISFGKWCEDNNSELISEWHPTKNGDLSPFEIGVGYQTKVWWLGKCGHEWDSKVYNRMRWPGCPYCSNKKLLRGFNDLESKYVEIAKEWHPTKNADLKPSDVLYGSSSKVWWLGKCGHEWETRIILRTRNGNGCPYCGGTKLLVDYNDLETKYPTVAAEWHPTKNGLKKPIDYTASSHEKIWWLGPCGHEWEATIANRTYRNSGCPYCESKKPIVGETDFGHLYPALAKQWHPTKNGNLKPSDFLPKSERKVWWLGYCGHEWDAVIGNRVANNAGCPYCSSRRVLAGFNDLGTRYEELSKEWHPTKNGNLKPSMVFPSSDIRVWWLGRCGHEWTNTICNRVNGSSCPECRANKKLSYNVELPLVRTSLSKEWHPTKNIDLDLNLFSVNSSQEVWWQCSKGHDYQGKIKDRFTGKTKCPLCSGFKKKIIPIKKKSKDRLGLSQRIDRSDDILHFDKQRYIEHRKIDLDIFDSDLSKEWHPIKNGNLKPSDVTAGSNKKVWWLGSCGHEWEAKIYNRHKGSGCPYCSNNKLLTGFNDLKTKNPELAAEWHPTKNGDLKPTDVLPGSPQKVWWLGSCGHEWEAQIASRSYGRRCPTCAKEYHISYSEKIVAYYLSKFLSIKESYIIDSDSTNELDIYVPDYQFAVEYDGQHYHKKTLDHDIEKNLICKKLGIELYRIREKGCPDIDGCYTIDLQKNDEQNILLAVNTLIDNIVQRYSIPQPDIVYNIDDDRTQIYELYIKARKDNSLARKYPKVAEEWDYDGNGRITPEYVSYATQKKFKWRCKKGHVWTESVNNRTVGNCNCPFCSNKRVLKGFNDLETIKPELAAEWHPTKNGDLKPSDIAYGSGKKVWWLCSNGHEWKQRVQQRFVSGACCKRCRKAKSGTDIQSLRPDLALMWDTEKNEKQPSEISLHSSNNYYWRCSKGHEWTGTPNNMSKKKNGCSKCSGTRK